MTVVFHDEDLYTYLKVEAARNHIPASEIISDAVREDAKVGLEGGALFGCKEDGFERINIACPRSTLVEGLDRLERAVALLRNC